MLGVPPSADEATLRRAYLALARRYHPDRGGDAARMRAVNHAWSVLRDPEARARYDRSLRPPEAAPAPGAPAAPRFRPGEEPDPRYPFDHDLTAEELADLADAEPVRITVDLPRWLRLLPAATFGAAVVTVFVGTVTTSEPLFAFGLMLGILAFAFFVSAPFIALLRGRRPDGDDD